MTRDRGTTPDRALSTGRRLRVAAMVSALAALGTASFALGGVPGTAGGLDVAVQAPGARPDGVDPSTAAPGLLALRPEVRISPGFRQRTVFTASGLSDEPAEATVWGFDAASVFSAADAARVAEVLGVSGTPVLDDWGAWTVGPQGSSEPSMTLHPDAYASLSYAYPGRVPSTAAGPAPDAAMTSAKEVLRSLGVDLTRVELAIVPYGSYGITTVTATSVIDLQVVGVPWTLSFVADGLQRLDGGLAPLVSLGTYPVIGAASAVDRLTDARFGQISDVVTACAVGTAGSCPSMVLPDPGQTAPPSPTPGGDLRWPVARVSLTSARLRVTPTMTGDGASLLVPAYELADGTGSTWTVLAVADDRLDFRAAR